MLSRTTMATNWSTIVVVVVEYNLFLQLLLFLLIVPVLFVDSTQEVDRKGLDELLHSGKNGMVKFYQPWCGHCKRMKPDWDLLAEEAPSSVFIVDVNCQVEGSLCADYHTGGSYPTVLVFKNNNNNSNNKATNIKPELYEGGRGFEDLLKFVDQYLAEPCDINHLETTCNEKEQKYTQKWKTRSYADWSKEHVRLSSMKGETMTYELSKWLGDRIRILEQLLASVETEL